MKERSQTKAHCEMYCEGGHDPSSPYQHLTILEDGVPITQSKQFKEMSDNVVKMSSGVRFDKALFNTPSAFDELVKWSDVLKQQVAVSSEKVFNSNDGTQFHLLPMVCCLIVTIEFLLTLFYSLFHYPVNNCTVRNL
jgi:hypothetical protein